MITKVCLCFALILTNAVSDTPHQNYKEFFVGKLDSEVTSVAWSTDGKTAAFCTYDKIILIDINLKKIAHVFNNKSGNSDSLFFFDNSTKLVSSNESSLIVIDLIKNKITSEIVFDHKIMFDDKIMFGDKQDESTTILHLNAENKLCVTLSEGNIGYFDFLKPEKKFTLEANDIAPVMSAIVIDKNLFFLQDDEGSIYSYDFKMPLKTIYQVNRDKGSNIPFFTIVPDGRKIVSTNGKRGELAILSMAGKLEATVKTNLTNFHLIKSKTWNNSAFFLFLDGTLCQLDLTKNEMVAKIKNDNVDERATFSVSLSVSPEGTYIVTGNPGRQLFMYNLQNKKISYINTKLDNICIADFSTKPSKNKYYLVLTGINGDFVFYEFTQ